MAINTTTDALSRPEIFCLVAQQSIDNKAFAPINLMKGTQFYDKIRQQTATYWSAEQDAVFNPGKGRPGEGGLYPRVFLTYTKPDCDKGESNCDINLCDGVEDAPTTDDQAALELTIDNCASRVFTLTKAEFRALCESPNQRLASKYSQYAKQIVKEINEGMLTATHGDMGAYKDGVASVGDTTIDLPIITPDGCVNPVAYAKVKSIFRKKSWRGDVCLVGGDMLATYFDVQQMGGFAKGVDSGADLNAFQNSFGLIYDEYVDDVYNELEGSMGSHLLAFPEGAYGLFEWYEHTGDCAENYEDLIRNVITIDGVRFDHTLYYDKKCQKWTIILKKWWCLGCIPDTEYCDTNGYKLHFNATCGTMSCDTILC